jgi:hypothetical protein
LFKNQSVQLGLLLNIIPEWPVFFFGLLASSSLTAFGSHFIVGVFACLLRRGMIYVIIFFPEFSKSSGVMIKHSLKGVVGRAESAIAKPCQLIFNGCGLIYFKIQDAINILRACAVHPL